MSPTTGKHTPGRPWNGLPSRALNFPALRHSAQYLDAERDAVAFPVVMDPLWVPGRRQT
jgi:hypothetical protein